MLLIDRTVKEFVNVLGSDSPAPGGGSAAALHGTLGASLIKMVGLLTTGKTKYAEHQDFIDKLIEKTEELQSEFLAVIDEDTEAFNQVSAVFSMPKETDNQKAARKDAMQAALKACTMTPYKMLELCEKAIALAENAINRTNTNAASDLGVAALSLKASAQGAWLNILINIGGITDETFTDKYKSSGEALLEKVNTAADRVYESILVSLT